jgi:hypothetical protein
MFKVIKFLFLSILAIVSIAFLHYNLPDRDIVRIVGTFEIRDDKPAGTFGAGLPDAGSKKFPNRDVRYITTKRPNGKPMVYSNQDTGWGWPPYFKFDTSNLTADAQDLILRYQANEEIWVAVKHYGWRVEMFSLYPNAVSLREVEGPDTKLFPLFNVVFLILLASLILFIWWRVHNWKTKNVDPITDKIGDELEDVAKTVSGHADAAGDKLSEGGSAIGRLWRKLFGTTKSK